jgi:hypothetical protein
VASRRFRRSDSKGESVAAGRATIAMKRQAVAAPEAVASSPTRNRSAKATKVFRRAMIPAKRPTHDKGRKRRRE